jgi:hypothetical protein
MRRFPSLFRPFQVPLLTAILTPARLVLIGLWVLAIAVDRKPLPFPDRHYHVHSASSPAALVALEDPMREQGFGAQTIASALGLSATVQTREAADDKQAEAEATCPQSRSAEEAHGSARQRPAPNSNPSPKTASTAMLQTA